MKVQCDVCKGKEEAAVFCCADEAALCAACDTRVHSANKLAGRHRRFSLHAASPHLSPLCDICQEKKAFLFCQEDRAILCRDCDAAIHDAANGLTRMHHRFLFTGIKLSPSPVPAASDPTSSSDSRPTSVAASSTTVATTSKVDGDDCPVAADIMNQSRRHTAGCAPKHHEKPAAAGKQMIVRKSKAAAAATCTGFSGGKAAVVEDKSLCSSNRAAASAGGSSISEYLMKELPGWHVEDLLLESCPPLQPATFVENLTPVREADLEDPAALAGITFPAEDGGKISAWWVPRVPQFCPALPTPSPADGYDQWLQQQLPGMAIGRGGELTQMPATTQLPLRPEYQARHRWTADDGFTVPDLVAIHHNAPPYKRLRRASWAISS